jgi:hypothetical protein
VASLKTGRLAVFPRPLRRSLQLPSTPSENIWPPDVLGREEAARHALKIYSNEFFQNAQNIKDCRLHSIVYLSGASGIGKSTFGEQLPKLMNSIPTTNPTEVRFQSATKKCEQIKIDFRSGDRFNAIIDPLLVAKDQRLHIRLLAHIAKFSHGLEGLLVSHSSNADWKKHIKWLKSQNLCSISNLLQTKFHLDLNEKRIKLPILEDIFAALAEDHRANSPNSGMVINKQPVVPIYVFLDNHHHLYNSFLEDNQNQKSKALQSQMDFFYHLMMIQGNGWHSWCFDNDIRVMPLFSGTNSECLYDLIQPNLFGGLHIPLRGLHVHECETLVRLKQMNDELLNIHESWFEKPTSKQNVEMSLIGLLAAKSMGNPLIFKDLITSPSLAVHATDVAMKNLTDGYKLHGLLPTGMYHAYEAILTGIPLTQDELLEVGQPELCDHAILVRPPVVENAQSNININGLSVIQMPPIILAKTVNSIPRKTFSILNGNYSSSIFEKAVGERLLMAINLQWALQRIAKWSSVVVTIDDLFGRSSHRIWSNEEEEELYHYQLPLNDLNLTDDGVINVPTGPPFWKNGNNTIIAIQNKRSMNTLEVLLEGKEKSVQPLLTNGIAHIGGDQHPLFDTALWMNELQHMWWIKLFPSQDFLDKEQFIGYLNALQQLRTENTVEVTHSTVFISARKLSEEEAHGFRQMVNDVVREHSQQGNIVRIGRIIVVDDLDNFVPPIAHWMKFYSRINNEEVSSLSEQSKTIACTSVLC